MKIIKRATAKIKNLKYYYTGKPCKRGHLAQRAVSNMSCSACVALVKGSYDKKYHRKHKTKICKNVARWTKANRQHVQHYQDHYYQVHREQRKDYQAERYREKRAHIRDQQNEYRRKNPGVHLAYSHRRRATKLLATPIWYEHKAIVQLLKTARDKQVHHIVPLNECKDIVCGLHCLANLVPLTKEQHNKLHTDRQLLEESWTWSKECFEQL